MKQSTSIPFFILLTCVAWNSHAETQWEKVRDKSGISVYTSETDNSDIIKVKTRVIIDASLKHIQQILDNAPMRNQWVPYLAHSRIIHRFSDNERLEYSLFSAPWPASDRDFVYRMTLLHQDDDKISYSMVSEVHSLMPENKDIVRAELIESIYTLTAIDNQKTHVELIFQADPKGWLPVWVINIIQKALPYLILRNLRELTMNKTAQENL